MYWHLIVVDFDPFLIEISDVDEEDGRLSMSISFLLNKIGKLDIEFPMMTNTREVDNEHSKK